jgi:membrane protease YdiL (CAAX protease family)
MAFVPMTAAIILVARESGVTGARAFLGRALDFRRVKNPGWILVALLLMPIVFVLAYGVMRVGGRALPDLQVFSVPEIVAYFLMFFVGAIGEELGWQGYAYAGLKTGRSALSVALTIGAVWGLWHVIPFAEMGRSADWIFWQCLGAIAMRIIIVWLFENAGQSVFVAVLFHVTINLPSGVFTDLEPYFDPFVLFGILALVAGVVTALWVPSTLARFRFGHNRA